MDALADRIQEKIRAQGGWIGFDAFMQLALYAPELGYYCGAGRPFGDGRGDGNGVSGDFVTAPMLGPWLAQGIWGWSKPLRRALAPESSAGKAGCFHVREFGAGRGDLAAALLGASQTDRCGGDEAQLAIEIIELSADMQRLQRQTTLGLGQVSWSASLRKGFCGLVLANEVLDAMPVRCFEWVGGNQVLEWGVIEDAASASGFAWQPRPADALLKAAVLARKDAADQRGLPWGKGYRGEHASWVAPWLVGLAESMDQGAVLIIDYGYSRHELDHPGRTDGTLCAHYQHRRIDDRDALLIHPGRQDLTAHVDFSLVAASAAAAGLDVLGFVTQARFLINAGLGEHAQSVLHPSPDVIARSRLTQSLQMLMSEAEMGEVFKVLLLTKNLADETCQALIETGFADGNRLASLA